jgi:RNA polymerase sigma-70 factor (ECF subfamily)
MGMCVTSDDDLMQAAAEGDEAAFGELMQRHQSWVRSLIRAVVHSQEQAEDLTQEAFCRVYQHLGRYSAQGQFNAWLKRIAVNLAKDHLRRKTQATLVPLFEIEDMRVEDSRFDPVAALELGVMRDEVREAIRRLPQTQRLPLMLHYFRDMSLQEIALMMDCPVGTVKSRLHYALRRVRQSLTAKWEC